MNFLPLAYNFADLYCHAVWSGRCLSLQYMSLQGSSTIQTWWKGLIISKLSGGRYMNHFASTYVETSDYWQARWWWITCALSSVIVAYGKSSSIFVKLGRKCAFLTGWAKFWSRKVSHSKGRIPSDCIAFMCRRDDVLVFFFIVSLIFERRLMEEYVDFNHINLSVM